MKKTDTDLLKVRSFGKTSLREVKRKLADMGLSLGMDLDAAAASQTAAATMPDDDDDDRRRGRRDGRTPAGRGRRQGVRRGRQVASGQWIVAE